MVIHKNHNQRASTSSYLPKLLAVAGGISTAVGIGTTIGASAALCSIVFDTEYKKSTFAHVRNNKTTRYDPLHQYRDEQTMQWFEETKQAVTLRSYDHATLHAWQFDADSARPAPHCYAICLHGYTGEPAEMAPWAYHYAAQGFTVLTPAQRGHELSGGRFVTMGYLEQRDLMQWVNYIVAQDPQAQILLHGNSMGAATVLLACANTHLAPHVVAAIADSSYLSVTDQLLHNVSALLHSPIHMAWPIVTGASAINKLRHGFSFQEVSPLHAVAHMHMPVLFLQGTQDHIVAPDCVRKLYAACSSNDCSMVEIEGAEHTAGYAVNPQIYWNAIDRFITRLFPDISISPSHT